MQIDTIRVLTDSIGEELAGHFQAIEEQGDGQRRKYDESVLRQLRRMIVCRNYGRALLELGNFTAALGALTGGQQGMVGLLWGIERASGQNFRLYLQDYAGASNAVSLDGEGITLTAGNAPFGIHFTRMPLLAALMDFVTGILGFDALLSLADKANAGGNIDKDMQDCVRQLQSSLYEWLKDQLISNQEQRKFRRLADYAGQRSIDDALILDFWREEAGAEDSDFRSFETAADSFISLLKAREAVTSRQAAKYASRIGTEREEGETDPDAIAASLAEWVEEDNLLARLADHPLDAIKFLTQKTVSSLQPVIDAQEQARRLPLTILRKVAFGAAQRSLTEAARRKDRGLEDALVQALDEDRGTAESSLRYAALDANWQTQAVDILRTEWATTGLLLTGNHASGLVQLARLEPGLDLERFEQALTTIPEKDGNSNIVSDNNVVSLSAFRQQPTAASATTSIFAQLATLRQEDPVLDRSLNLANKELKGIARKGFRPAILERDDDRQEALEDGIALLALIRQQLIGFLSDLPSLLKNYDADRSIFMDMYRQLYNDSLKGTA